MSERDIDADTASSPGSRDRPVVAIDPDPELPMEALIRVIIRAHEHNHAVFLVTTGHRRPDAISYADDLGASILEINHPQTTTYSDHKLVSDRARSIGFPGVIWTEDPAQQIDFATTEDVVQSHDDYLVEAVYESTGAEDHGERGGLEEGVEADQRGGIITGIPTYNEEIAIGSIVVQAQRYAEEVIVVDDGSSDDTVAIAAEAGATVIEQDENKGKGKAIRTLLDSLDPSEMEALVLLDGDGQHVPAEIPQVAEPVIDGDCDVAIGSRYIGDGTDETPLYRRFGQRTLDVMTLGSTGTMVTDSQSGFRALSPKAISKLDISANGMGVESEIINEAADSGLTVSEVPIDVRYEGVDGQTHNPLRHGLEVVGFLLQLVRDRHPLVFFGLPGLITLGIGSVLGIHTWWLYQTSGAFHQWRVLMSGFTILLGSIGIMSGLVLSQVRNMVMSVTE